jgi:hypothetical protein
MHVPIAVASFAPVQIDGLLCARFASQILNGALLNTCPPSLCHYVLTSWRTTVTLQQAKASVFHSTAARSMCFTCSVL